MGNTASVYANRITVWVTGPQREFLFAGTRRHQIGLSEYVRRVLDRVLADAEAAEERRAPR